MNIPFVRSLLLTGAVLLLSIAGYAADNGNAAPAVPAAVAPDQAAPAAGPIAAGQAPAAVSAPVAAAAPATNAAPSLPNTTAPQTTVAPAAQPAAVVAPLTPEPSAPEAQVVSNPYGLGALWDQGDFIARGTLLTLVIMSAASWYVLVTKTIEQAGLLRQVRRANRSFWTTGSVEAGVTTLRPGSAFHVVASSGIDAAGNHGGSLGQNIDFNAWVSQSIQRAVDQIVSRLQGGLAVLATVGSIAPFVGLFGTVWGIYHALTAIGIAGQASIDKVAGPVGEALIMTAIGLAVAVPAVLGYNWLVRRNKVAVEQLRAFGSDLHSVLIGGRPPLAVRGPAATRTKQLVQAA